MKDKRKPGQSLLDYLWDNYGIFSVSTRLEEDPSEYIPTLSLITKLLKELSTKVVGGISIKNTDLIIYSAEGTELDRIDISELQTNSVSIVDFGSKIVTLLDILIGCPYELFDLVYYISLSNGRHFWAKKDSIKLAEEQGNVILTIEDGLKAELPLYGSDDLINFYSITLREYEALESPQSGTLYFIKDLPYFYINGVKIGGTIELFEVVDSLPVNGDSNKIYLILNEDNYSAYIYINGVACLIGSVGNDAELRKDVDNIKIEVDNIKTNLNWIEY